MTSFVSMPVSSTIKWRPLPPSGCFSYYSVLEAWLGYTQARTSVLLATTYTSTLQ
jgi:hypothetical protein